MAKILITGAAGFLGQHLLRGLADDHDLIGVDLSPCPPPIQSSWIQLSEPAALAQSLYDQDPELVVHAAFVNRRPDHQSEQSYLEEMLGSNQPLFQAAAEIDAKLLLVSSSAVYGAAQGRGLIDEDCPLEPVTLYGQAKTQQEALAHTAVDSAGLQLAVLRLFNLCGPGQRPGMLLPDWVRQTAAIARGEASTLKVFNLATSRDFVDARDVARAVGALAADFRAGSTLNVASGRATHLTEIIELLKGLCPQPFEVEQTRPQRASGDVLRQQGCFAKLQQGWGWAPRIPFETSLADLWEEWTRAGASPQD